MAENSAQHADVGGSDFPQPGEILRFVSNEPGQANQVLRACSASANMPQCSLKRSDLFHKIV